MVLKAETAVVKTEWTGKRLIIHRQKARTLLLFTIFLLAPGIEATEKIVFKRLTTAILKMDGKQVKFWEVYQAEKHGHLLFVQLGRRYLLLDTKEKEILEIDPRAIEQVGKEKGVAWSESPGTEKTVESEGWSMRSVGPAIAIKVQLSAEGRLLEIQVPRRPDTGWFY